MSQELEPSATPEQEPTPDASDEAVQQLVASISTRLQAGESRETIAADLTSSGMTPDEAAQLVDNLDDARLKLIRDEAITPHKLAIAALAAGWAALIGGILWGLIAIFTEREIAYVALGVGFVCGLAVVKCTKARGFPVQLLAMLSSIVGIFIGKYVILAHFIKQSIAEQQGKEAAADVAYVSLGMFQLFVENVQHLLSPFDLLWFGLAMFTAWQMPRKTTLAEKIS